MDFLDHARIHGLMISHLQADGRWHRVPTEDKPRKKNGAYLWNGQRGVVKNWATMEDFATFPPRGERFTPIDQAALKASKARADKLAAEARQIALKRASEDMLMSQTAGHPYLFRKGFPEATGRVLNGYLVIPMRDYRTDALVNVQKINPDGEKRFLTGGQSKGAIYKLGPAFAKERWLVEGYATGLSVKAALDAMYRKAQVWVCFSAGNLLYVSQRIGGNRYVFADNDASGTGQRIAKETGLPWIMSPVEGEDANDLHQRAGIWELVKLMRGLR